MWIIADINWVEAEGFTKFFISYRWVEVN